MVFYTRIKTRLPKTETKQPTNQPTNQTNKQNKNKNKTERKTQTKSMFTRFSSRRSILLSSFLNIYVLHSFPDVNPPFLYRFKISSTVYAFWLQLHPSQKYELVYIKYIKTVFDELSLKPFQENRAFGTKRS